MKQILSVVFLSLFLFLTGGYYLVFKIQQQKIKKEIKTRIKAGVPKNELIRFVETPQNKHLFNWKHSKEFSFENQMFDVVWKKVINKDSVVYECVSDKQETILFAHLHQMIQNQMDQNGTNQDITKLLNLKFEHLVLKFNFIKVQIQKNEIGVVSNIYLSPFSQSNEPPPKELVV